MFPAIGLTSDATWFSLVVAARRAYCSHLPRSPAFVVLLGSGLLAAACPGRRALEAPLTGASVTTPATDDDAANLRIDLGDAPRVAPGPDPVAVTDASDVPVSTPTRLVEAWPRWLSERDPVLVLHFDQRVDPAAVLPALRVEVEGGAPPLRLATPAERARPEVREQLAGLDPARTATFAFTAPLPLRVGVEVWMTGVPSAESALRSPDRDSFTFSVHDGLRVLSIGCSSGPVCRPGDALVVRFSAHLRDLPGLRQRIRVHPALDGEVEVSETEIYLNGATRAYQTYEVTLPADFEDKYGQTLGQAKTLRVRIAGPEPSFDVTGGTSITMLAPDEPRALMARTVNVASLQVVVYATRPADWSAYVESMYFDQDWRTLATARFGPPVLSYRVPVTGAKDQLVETAIDLATALPRGLGQAIVEVRPVDWPDAQVPRFRTWLQATRIGVDAIVDATTLLAWTTDLQTGAALPGVRVELGAAAARSDADGLARLPLPATIAPVLTATLGKDVAMLADGFVRSVPAPLLLPVVVTDRGVYRPGETVQVKGWLRRHARGPRGELEPVTARALTYTLVDAAGVERRSGPADITSHGSFDFTITLPAAVGPGEARLFFAAGDEHFAHALRIADRGPPYTLTVRSSAGPHIVGGHVDLTASARTAAGGPWTAAPLQWTVHQSPAHFTPPGHEGFQFGRQRYAPATQPATYFTYTDARGEHVLRARFTALTIREPTTVIAEAGVRDPDPLALSSAVTLLVHPASLYVGLRSAHHFVAAGQPLVVDAIVTDLDGKRIADRPILVRGHGFTADGKPGRSLGECRLRSAREPVRCTLEPQGAGSYAFTATVVDEHGRAQDSELALWVAGEPAERRPAEAALRVVPDHDHYRVGETARVLVLAPFAPAEGLWTIRRDGVHRSRRFRMPGTSTILELPIDEAMQPGAVVHVQLVGQQPRSRTDRLWPAHAQSDALLAVPPAGRTLDLSFEPASPQLEPGARRHLDVTVRGPDARPVAGAEVTVFVVDEAALALPRLAGLFADFLYPDLGTGTIDHRSRHALVSTDPAGVAPPAYPFAPSLHNPPAGVPRDGFAVLDLSPTAGHHGSRVRLAGSPGPHPGDAIALRSASDAPVVFTPTVLTDAAGRARVTFTLPGGLTRYRVLAYATAGARRFGATQTTLTASQQ